MRALSYNQRRVIARMQTGLVVTHGSYTGTWWGDYPKRNLADFNYATLRGLEARGLVEWDVKVIPGYPKDSLNLYRIYTLTDAGKAVVFRP